ncbi:MAG: hypothetical protein COB26_02220 [Piscirickettsiaceae bacterium]|nr:MAG: hypothetical protein COB26_02220 [Piscirickettsiaceae bacterium]
MSVTTLTKRFLIALLPIGLIACSYMPETPDIFTDQKEAYKEAHELPPLEVPPELSSLGIEDTHRGSIKQPASILTKTAVVKTTALIDKTKPEVEIFKLGNVSYLLVRDSFRSAWRKTVSALEALEYDIEDKNREESLIHLNINDEVADTGMLSSLTFWKSASTTAYRIHFVQYSDAIAVKVQDDKGALVNNEVSEKIYTDLLKQLAP